ncbi:MAG: hypothetical protein KJ899_12925, partial [Gammaproteobacteria bacterium]|nr:hypothetical protein [Gammaproteobacteria bacterium]
MKKFEIQKRKAMLIRLAGLVRCAVLAISTPAFADRYTDAVCEYGCGSRVDWGGLSIMLLIIFWLGWFGTSLTSRASRVWYSLAIGSYGLWAVSHANFEIASVGWLAIVSVGLLWWLGEDQTEVNVKKQKSNDASDVDDVMHISKDKPSATTKQDIPSATISLEAISAEDQHKANKYRKLISYGYTFVPENNNVVSISPEGKREVIYTSFQLDDLIDAV